MFLISVDQKKQQVLGWTGSHKKLMTSQEEGPTYWSRNHTQKTGQVLKPYPATTTILHHLHTQRHDAAVLEPVSYCMSASDPVHKYIAVRTVKAPWDHVWLSAESGAATSVLLTTATTHPGSRPPPPRLSLDKQSCLIPEENMQGWRTFLYFWDNRNQFRGNSFKLFFRTVCALCAVNKWEELPGGVVMVLSVKSLQWSTKDILYSYKVGLGLFKISWMHYYFNKCMMAFVVLWACENHFFSWKV